jgi:hypothetical protein
VALSFLYQFLGQMLGLVRAHRRDSSWKDAEILVLRHQLAVPRRQVGRPRFSWSDRALMALLASFVPRERWRSFLVTPQTVTNIPSLYVDVPSQFRELLVPVATTGPVLVSPTAPPPVPPGQPEPGRSQPFERSAPLHLDYGHREHRTHARSQGERMKGSRSALGNYDPCGPGTVRAADQGAKVAGVLETVSYHYASLWADGDFRPNPSMTSGLQIMPACVFPGLGTASRRNASSCQAGGSTARCRQSYGWTRPSSCPEVNNPPEAQAMRATQLRPSL